MRSLRAVLAASLVLISVCGGTRAHAQSPSELAAGRQLFTEALADEEGGRFAAALEKYRRVQGIRDTINVRYRIGTSLEGLGKVAKAVDAYAAAVQLGIESNADAEVVRAARTRLEVLRPRVAHLAIRVTPPAFADAEVSIDSEPVAASSFGDVSVDPGAHVVTAQARGARPFRTQLTVAEGGHTELAVVLEPFDAPPPPPPQPPVSADRSGAYRTAGIVTGAAGGLLVIGGAVVLALRSSAISDLEASCPDGRCPASREQELRSTRDRALLEGPVGAALLITGAAALGTGIFLFAVPGRDTTTATRFVPSPTAQGAMLSVVRSF